MSPSPEPVSPKFKKLGPSYNQAVWLENSVSQFTEPKIIILLLLKTQQRLKEHVSLNNSLENSHQNHKNRIFYENISSSIFASYMDLCHELFCVFEDFYASGTYDAEVTKSQRMMIKGCGNFTSKCVCSVTLCSVPVAYNNCTCLHLFDHCSFDAQR